MENKSEVQEESKDPAPKSNQSQQEPSFVMINTNGNEESKELANFDTEAIQEEEKKVDLNEESFQLLTDSDNDEEKKEEQPE